MAKRDVFLALEGGGAKGLAHISARRAIDLIGQEIQARAEAERKKANPSVAQRSDAPSINQDGTPNPDASLGEFDGLEIAGVAGTSAGAIVAALIAVGYSADELFNPNTQTHLLRTLKRGGSKKTYDTAIELLGHREWLKIQLFRRLVTYGGRLALLSGAVFLALDYGLRALLPIPWPELILLMIGLCVFSYGYRLSHGFAKLDSVRDGIDSALKQKLNRSDSDDRVRFNDFGANTPRPSLKIVATDITHGRMRLFSPETTPCIPVAEAVAASICIPLVFKPWRIDDSNAQFLDGGLVSNLPAWPFDEERLLNRKALTIAVEIADGEPNQARKSGIIRRALGRLGLISGELLVGRQSHWLPRALRTAIFGANDLNKRASGELELLRLDIGLGVLDFDAPTEKVASEVKKVTEAAANQLRYALTYVPKLMKKSSSVIRSTIDALLTLVNRRRADQQNPLSGRSRVAFAIQDKTSRRSFQLLYDAGYQGTNGDGELHDDPDRYLVIPAEGSFVGESARSGLPIFAPLHGGPSLRIYGPTMNRAELEHVAQRAWRESRWQYCHPFPAESLPERWRQLVLVIDGSHNLPGLPQLEVDGIMDLIRSALHPIIDQLTASLKEGLANGAPDV